MQLKNLKCNILNFPDQFLIKTNQMFSMIYWHNIDYFAKKAPTTMISSGQRTIG